MTTKDTFAKGLRTGKQALLAGADATHAATSFVKRHEGKVAGLARGCAWLLGKTVQGVGAITRHGAGAIAAAAQRQVASAENDGARLLAQAARGLAAGVQWAGRGVEIAGEATCKVAPAAGRAVGGAVSGGTGMVSEVFDSVAIHEYDIDCLRMELDRYGKILGQRADARLAQIKAAQRAHDRAALLDALVVGGVTLGAIVRAPGVVPPEVDKAFALAYPGLAQHESFAQAVQHMDADQLVGLVNGVKGKMFELTLADHLNSGGHLPPGWHAELAKSATEPAWDLRVLDQNGHVADLIQAKATDAAGYVQHALERYPNVPITTTHEVYAHLAALGVADHVVDSGVSLATLDAQMHDAVTAAAGQFHGISIVPSTLSLAVIALSLLMDRESTLEMAAAQFGERGAKAGLAGGAAKAAMVATQTWWIGLLAGVGSRWLAGKGAGKRARYQMLKDAVRVLRGLLNPNGAPPPRPTWHEAWQARRAALVEQEKRRLRLVMEKALSSDQLPGHTDPGNKT
ncbi:MAG: hypothetical protein JSS45_01860 [Proteobacteria bacterium]|nr:hypothetical protein [Pseudomonadota bacterium]